jgi:hypothetical protein
MGTWCPTWCPFGLGQHVFNGGQIGDVNVRRADDARDLVDRDADRVGDAARHVEYADCIGVKLAEDVLAPRKVRHDEPWRGSGAPSTLGPLGRSGSAEKMDRVDAGHAAVALADQNDRRALRQRLADQ